MFIESEFSWTIIVDPHDFKGVRQIRNLLTGFDGKVCTEEHGYHIAVTGIENVGEGTIKEGKGCITYPVSFRGLTFRPLKGEIVYATVSQVTEVGIKAEFGPGEFGVIGKGEEHMGEYKYDEEDRVWKHTDDHTQIDQGTTIRAEIVSIEWLEKSKRFRICGSLKGEFLGVVQLPSTCKC